jgi:hypothetical protein
MTGKKAHAQQLRIIEKRVNTKNADPDFDPRPDLERSEHGLPPVPRTTTKTASDPENPDDRGMLRGMNQESEHHKRRGKE